MTPPLASPCLDSERARPGRSSVREPPRLKIAQVDGTICRRCARDGRAP